MSGSELNIRFTLNELLAGAEKLNARDLEQFFEELLALRAKRRNPGLPKREAELLEKINRGLTPEKQARFNELVARRKAGTINEMELQELLVLVDQIETMDAERVGYLGELATLRNISVKKLMKQLGIQPSYDA